MSKARIGHLSALHFVLASFPMGTVGKWIGGITSKTSDYIQDTDAIVVLCQHPIGRFGQQHTTYLTEVPIDWGFLKISLFTYLNDRVIKRERGLPSTGSLP